MDKLTKLQIKVNNMKETIENIKKGQIEKENQSLQQEKENIEKQVNTSG
jgi:hypothetical protein